MRWVVLMLVLAGCTQTLDAPKEHQVLLLGAEACHEGICYRGDRDDAFRHLLEVERAPRAVTMTGDWVVWSDALGVWAFDRDSRALRLIAEGEAQIAGYEHGVIVLQDGIVRAWGPADQSWQTIGPERDVELLGVGQVGVLLVERTDRLRFLVYDWDRESVRTFDSGKAGGRAFGADNGGSVYWVVSDDGAHAWHQIGTVVAPVWSGPDVTRAAAGGGRLWLGTEDTFWRVDPVNGDTEAMQAGRLLDVNGTAPVWVQRDEFADAAIFVGTADGPQVVYPVTGKAVLQADMTGRGMVVVLSGPRTTIAVPV